jgi:8-oxo-dGTP pyrophosphatase MutT (NUDIX family)/predicted nucleotidyltransferase
VNKGIKRLKNLLESKLKNERFLVSAYMYGSILRNDYTEGKSDVDVLLIVKDKTNMRKAGEKINEIASSCSNLKLEFTVITEYEFYNGFHPSWTEYFFIALKGSSVLVCGRDILNEFNFEISFDSVYKKTLWLCQRLRNVIINNTKQDEIEFWDRKYEKWIEIIISEILYLHGIYDSSPKKLLLRFRKIYPQIYVGTSTIGDKYKTMQCLEDFLVGLKENERIRNGVITILYKRRGKKKYFLLLKSRDDWKGWEFIKGGIKGNETTEEAARREVYEETGIKDIVIKKALPFKTEINMISDKGLEKRVYTPVIAEFPSSRIIPENKFEKADIFDFENAIKNIKWPTYRSLFFKAMKWFTA